MEFLDVVAAVLQAVFAFVQEHEVICLWAVAALVDAMPDPDGNSGKFYLFVFRLAHIAGANLSRLRKRKP